MTTIGIEIVSLSFLSPQTRLFSCFIFFIGALTHSRARDASVDAIISEFPAAAASAQLIIAGCL